MNRLRYLFTSFLLLITHLVFAQGKISFDEDTPPQAPDYSDNASWAALPFKHNFSDSMPIAGLERDSQKVDVFFIYPTSYIGKHEPTHYWNADIHDEDINAHTNSGAILNQASVFNICSKIYAPYYRQAHLAAFYTANDGEKALTLAYSDVRRAFIYYMEHYNNGRSIIIASHSQGSHHAKQLLKEFFDGKPLYKKLVAAYIIGMPVNPDSMQHIPACRDSLQTGCYCTWNTFKYGYYPTYYESQGLNHAICTNPLTWAVSSVRASAELNIGGVLDHFNTLYPELCDAEVREGMLWVHPPRVHTRLFKIFKIYHIVDYNLFYMNIRKNVKQRVNAYLTKH